jgi:XrtJ-associated TM-motif-TM protein
VKSDPPMGQIAIEEKAMKKVKFLIAFGIALIATSAVRLHAQSGCEDSPENPTAVLAVLGSVAAFGVHTHRRFLAWRASRKDHR